MGLGPGTTTSIDVLGQDLSRDPGDPLSTGQGRSDLGCRPVSVRRVPVPTTVETFGNPVSIGETPRFVKRFRETVASSTPVTLFSRNPLCVHCRRVSSTEITRLEPKTPVVLDLRMSSSRKFPRRVLVTTLIFPSVYCFKVGTVNVSWHQKRPRTRPHENE